MQSGVTLGINNPKIPLRFVLDSGSLVYPTLTQGQAVLLPPSSPLKPDED